MGGKGGSGVSFPNSYNDIQHLVRLQEEAAQRAAERTADYNFFDVQTPFGQRRFVGTPGEEGFRMVESLRPRDELILRQQRAQTLRGQDLATMGQRLALGQLQGADFLRQPVGGADSASTQQARARVERATFNRARNLLQPGFEQERARLENDLVQRGLPRSGEAFTQESDRLARQQGSALENLALSSVRAGREEQSRILQSDIARRNAALAEMSALGGGGMFGGGAPPMLPQFQPTPNISMGAADVVAPAGLAAQVQGQNQAQQLAAKNAGLSGATQLGSAALLAYGGGKGG